MLEKSQVALKKSQSRDRGNIGHNMQNATEMSSMNYGRDPGAREG